MDLAAEYRRQCAWRSWPTAFDALPSLEGALVLDLGCGIGDQAAELSARGASVIGFDSNGDLLAAARSRDIPRTEFRNGDLRSLEPLEREADGIWCSFAAAYFPDLAPVLATWTRSLRRGGWIALSEIDDMFGHEPLVESARSLLDAYAAEALAAQRYDFHMGRKLRARLETAGLTVERCLALDDLEFSFVGPARADVLEAWRARFDRMIGLQAFCGASSARVRDDFLGCLAHPEHRSRASVQFCIATR